MVKDSDKSNMLKMEQEIKSLQKHMAGLVRTILDLKSEVEALKKKDEDIKKDDMESLLERQKTVDKAIAANSAPIIKIDNITSTIPSFCSKKCVKYKGFENLYKGEKI